MSIRPVDLQVTVQRTPELNRTMSSENNRPEVAQQQVSEKFTKEVRHNEQSVIASNKTEKQQIDKDGRGSQGYSGKGKKKKREADESDEKRKPKGSSMFDVSI